MTSRPGTSDPWSSAALVCPVCRGALLADGPVDSPGGAPAALLCEGCGSRYPVRSGVPVLLPPGSAFDAAAVAAGDDAYFPDQGAEDERRRRIRRALPGLASDLEALAVDDLVNGLLHRTDGARPAGLVVGAGRRAGEYAQRFPSVDWLVTDVEVALGAGVVADVLALPVPDASVDMVLAEHVLEHVVDPVAACREIERVLRPGGVVLAKVPFNYPWHGGYVDFFRFTPAGFLAAFRSCEPVHVGHGPGPFSSVAYLLQHDWVSMFRGRRARRIAAGAGRLGLGWLKHLDRFVIHRPGSLGATTTLVFVGRRGTAPRSAQEVVAAARRLGAAPVGPPPVVDRC